MQYPAIAAVTAGTLIVFQMMLMVETGMARIRRLQLLGEGADEAVLRSIRRHGNLAENAAIFVAVLALVEMAGGAPMAVAAAGTAFVLGRVMHAAAFSLPVTARMHAPLRGLGFLLTGLSGVLAGAWLVWLALARLTA